MILENGSAPQKGKERGYSWLAILLILSLVSALLGGGYWVFNEEPAGTTLKYGELKQILLDPSVVFRKVKVGRSEIRGEMLTRDRASGGDGQTETTHSV